MHLRLALLVACLAFAGPLAQAQSVATCPNTFLVQNRCDEYAPTEPEAIPGYGESIQVGGGPTVLYAPSEADDPAYRTAIATALGGTVDYFDVQAGTPTLAELLAYDAVYTWANFAYFDPIAFGDVLADFVDAGGAVVLGAFTTYDTGNSLGGAIRTVGYSPVANPTGSNHFLTDSWAGDGTLFYTNVTTLECNFRDILVTQGSGAVDGTYLDGEILGAYLPDFSVMFMNGEGASQLGCPGDWAQLLANMILQFIPVELTNFTATANGTSVSLAWATASETNNAGFEIQIKSGDTWSPAGFVDGHGTTTEAQTYSYTVGDLAPGTYAFRLRQVDFDGAMEYSPEVEATIGVVGSHQISEVYPNPFNPRASFDLAVAQTQHVEISLYNVLGQQVATLFSGMAEANQTQTLTLDGRALASGLYVVRATGEYFNATRQVTLLK